MRETSEPADWRRQVNRLLGELTGEASVLDQRAAAGAEAHAALVARLERLEQRVATLERYERRARRGR
jgi:hypothetical protein